MNKIMKIVCCIVMVICFGCSPKSHLDSDSPVTVKLWNYYTGKQLEAFNNLVETFNSTRGKEKGIIVEATSFGNVNELGQSVIDAANKKVGAQEVPNIFAAYVDTAYQVNKLGLVENLKPYFSEKELLEYVDGYIEEGYFGDELKIFPTAKATEVMMINMTDFDKFAKATGASLDDLSTIEGLTATAKKYYEYTDSLTTQLNDGKALFGRDAIANYIIIGLKQLGHDIIKIEDEKAILDFDKDSMRKIWDNYYIPFIHGYFKAEGRFRSDDVKLGNIVSCVCSSSGATFFPTQVIVNDEESYPIDVKVIEAPIFKGGNAYAVQQGAGMVVSKSDAAHVEGSVEFLKWFTQQEQNVTFSVDSGYLPVTKAANNIETIQDSTNINSSVVQETVEISVKTVNDKQLYTLKAFNQGANFRSILESDLQNKVVTDRKIIEKELNSGKSSQEVFAQYDTDDNFEQWYKETYDKLTKLLES